MRIVYLNPCGQMGGAETSLRELLAGVRAAAPDWQLCLVLGEDGPLARVAQDLGVQVMVVPFPPALAKLGDSGSRRFTKFWSFLWASVGSLAYARRLARILRRLRPDVIHTNGFKMHVLGAWSRPRGTAVVWHIHDYVRTRSFMSRLLRLASDRCTVAIANSKSVAADLQALVPGLQIQTIYNAVDLKRFAPEGAVLDLDAIAGLPPAPNGTVRVGLVATFARWKGHYVFLQALARLASDTSVRGYIIGGPIYQTHGSQCSLRELEQEARRLGLAGKVGFTGFLEDTSAAVRSLDILVHASTQPEPFGMVIIEGMACERAVVASRAGGASELLEEGRNALSHPPGDAAALAQQILRLARDEQLRRRLGKAGRRNAEQFYHRGGMASAAVALYQSVSGASDRISIQPAPRERGTELFSPAHRSE